MTNDRPIKKNKLRLSKKQKIFLIIFLYAIAITSYILFEIFRDKIH
ncbi:hypothetical protein BG03_5757 (plasmid) [Bacillus cereus]|jgi:hypothetical protein|nr:hypothetical protein BG03_5757 [Bacillus cereus]